jgi:hypothetical protein
MLDYFTMSSMPVVIGVPVAMIGLLSTVRYFQQLLESLFFPGQVQTCMVCARRQHMFRETLPFETQPGFSKISAHHKFTRCLLFFCVHVAPSSRFEAACAPLCSCLIGESYCPFGKKILPTRIENGGCASLARALKL